MSIGKHHRRKNFGAATPLKVPEATHFPTDRPAVGGVCDSGRRSREETAQEDCRKASPQDPPEEASESVVVFRLVNLGYLLLATPRPASYTQLRSGARQIIKCI